MKQKNVILFLSLIYTSFLRGEDFYYNGNKKVVLKKINSQTNTNLRQISTTTYYKTENNITLGLNNEIILKLRDKNMLEYLATKYNLIIIKELYTNTYLVKVTTQEETLSKANKLFAEESIEYASPNFIKTINKR